MSATAVWQQGLSGRPLELVLPPEFDDTDQPPGLTVSRCVDEAVVHVRWTLHASLPDLLAKAEAVEQARVLIVDRDENGRELRWLARLDQDGAWCQFQSPGRHLLQATVVWGPDIRQLLRKDGLHSFRYSALDLDGHVWTTLTDVHRLPHEAIRELHIGDGPFAQEPPPWLRTYCGLFFTHKPVDQCDLRRRFLFTTGLFALLAGMLAIIGLVLSWFIPLAASWMGVHWWEVAIAGGLGAAMVLVIIGFVVGISRLVDVAQAVIPVRQARWSARRAERERRWRTEDERKRLALLAQLAAGERPGKSSLGLRFLWLKSKVCRPYAR